MSKAVKSHAAAEIFPLLDGDAFAELKADIAKHGLREPIWLYRVGDEDLILDGRNRWRACEELKIEPATRLYSGDDPIAFVVSLNLARRHLNTGQKAAVAVEVERLYAEEARRRQAHGQTAPGKPLKDDDGTLPADRQQASTKKKKRNPESTAKAAKVSGTSGRSVARFKRLMKDAPDLAAKVKAGELALDRAERVVRDRVAEVNRRAEMQAKAAALPLVTSRIEHGRFQDVLVDLRNVDAIITDPPYGREWLPDLRDLAAWADKVLKPDGTLAVLIGQSYLPEVFEALDGFRPYRWTIAYMVPGPHQSIHHRHVMCGWKPVLVYGGERRFFDVVRSEGGDAVSKARHKWGQNFDAFARLVEQLTAPGETVVDPFMGAGTTLIAARTLGRHCIGCDIDPEAVSGAREYLDDSQAA